MDVLKKVIEGAYLYPSQPWELDVSNNKKHQPQSNSVARPVEPAGRFGSCHAEPCYQRANEAQTEEKEINDTWRVSLGNTIAEPCDVEHGI